VGGPPLPQSKYNMVTAAVLKIDMTSYFGNACSDLYEIRQPDAEQHADYGEMVEIETGSRNSNMADVCFSRTVNWDMSTKFVLLIDFDLLKAVISTNIKPEVVLSGRGRHFEKWIWHHISAVGAPISTKFGIRVQNAMQITAKWSISKPEVEFQ